MHFVLFSVASVPPFIVFGDFNCRHTLWGNFVVTSRGWSFDYLLHDFDLTLLNSGAPTHFDLRTQTFSCLDLVFCSPSIILDLHWSVLEHNPAVTIFLLSSFLPRTYLSLTPFAGALIVQIGVLLLLYPPSISPPLIFFVF